MLIGYDRARFAQSVRTTSRTISDARAQRSHPAHFLLPLLADTSTRIERRIRFSERYAVDRAVLRITIFSFLCMQISRVSRPTILGIETGRAYIIANVAEYAYATDYAK